MRVNHRSQHTGEDQHVTTLLQRRFQESNRYQCITRMMLHLPSSVIRAIDGTQNSQRLVWNATGRRTFSGQP